MDENKSIEELNKRLEAIIDSNPHINILFDSNFKIIDCNTAALKFMRFETKDELRAGFMERITNSLPEFQSGGRASIPIAERFKTTIMEGHVKFTTDLVLAGEDRNIDVEFIKIPYNGSFAIVAYVFDMTEVHRREIELEKAHKQNEAQLAELNSAVQALKAAQEIVSEMFNSNPHINILFDSNFKVIDCNPAAMKFMGFDTKEEFFAGFIERIKNSIPPTLSNGRQTRPIFEWFGIAIKEGFVNFETEFLLGGTKRFADIELKKIPYGESFAIVGYVLDITESKNSMLTIEKHRAEAEAANKAKSSFLSTMSHEIRTPMNAILGITEIQLQNENLDKGVREALDKIYVSGDMLLGIINDILDLSKIEAGKLELIIAKYEIASLISDTAQLNMMRIGSKPIEFELEIDENVPLHLLGDELRVKQIMNNVLSNAFKYTMAGMVKMSISAERSSNSDDTVTMIFSVSDTGQGMSKEQVERLFDEYSRFNTEANRSTEGTGLGMSITQNLVRLMGGEIFIESELDKGSMFRIHLPQRRADSRVLGRELAENLKQFRSNSRAQMKRVQIAREPMPYGSVLVVDDVETNIYVAKGLLAPYELKFDSADSGFEAIQKIKNGSAYDIIFMDHMMPKMDGVEAVKIIRELKYTQPIIALTANAVAGQADIFIGNGFDDYISKPIDVRQMNAVLNKFIRDKQPPEVIEAARKQAETRKDHLTESTSNPFISPRFAEILVRDANKAIKALEAIREKDGDFNDEEMRTFIINVHGMKSALANIGRMELSAAAMKLEVSGRSGDTELIASKLPVFINSLQALVAELSPKKETESSTKETKAEEKDLPFLREKLLVIKSSCEDYDEANIETLLAELWEKTWPEQAKELLDGIAEHLLHSEFDEIKDLINKFLIL